MMMVEPVIADHMLASLWDRTRLRWLCRRPCWRVCRVPFLLLLLLLLLFGEGWLRGGVPYILTLNVVM